GGARGSGLGGGGESAGAGGGGAVGEGGGAVYRPSTGQFIVLNPNGTVDPPITIGVPNQVPVPAQYDNLYYFQHGQAYKTEAAVFDPSTGIFTIAGPTGNYTVTFQANDIPAAADYAGTGSIQPA